MNARATACVVNKPDAYFIENTLIPQLDKHNWNRPSVITDGGGNGYVLPNSTSTLHLVHDTSLFRVGGDAILNTLAPDLIIMDESHRLNAYTSASARRQLINRYIRDKKPRVIEWKTVVLKDKSLLDLVPREWPLRFESILAGKAGVPDVSDVNANVDLDEFGLL